MEIASGRRLPNIRFPTPVTFSTAFHPQPNLEELSFVMDKKAFVGGRFVFGVTVNSILLVLGAGMLTREIALNSAGRQTARREV